MTFYLSSNTLNHDKSPSDVVIGWGSDPVRVKPLILNSESSCPQISLPFITTFKPSFHRGYLPRLPYAIPIQKPHNFFNMKVLSRTPLKSNNFPYLIQATLKKEERKKSGVFRKKNEKYINDISNLWRRF